jgi:hypothetical protein
MMSNEDLPHHESINFSQNNKPPFNKGTLKTCLKPVQGLKKNCLILNNSRQMGEIYFKSPGSSNEGFKIINFSQKGSSQQSIPNLMTSNTSNIENTLVSHKSVNLAPEFLFSEPGEKFDTNETKELKFITKNNSFNSSDKSFKSSQSSPNICLLNNVKLVYDQNTDRSRKRVQQMKKIWSTRSDSHGEELQDMMLNTGNTENSVNKSSKITPSDLEPKSREAYNSYSKKTEQLESIDSNPNDAEVIVSDLDCSYEESEIKVNHKRQKSFVEIKNNLTVKSTIKEDNATPSYLMALYNCLGVNPENLEEDTHKKNTINCDSLDKESNLQECEDIKKEEENLKEQNPKHTRWHSGKYLHIANSVIEEEISETYTDSEISNKKKSFLFSKSKIESSEKKAAMRTSRDFIIEKNLENLFNKAKDKESLNSSANNTVDHKNNLSNSLSSKFNYEKESAKRKERKMAKSEVFNIQIDMKKTLDEISKKISNEDEKHKLKQENKKKELLNIFFNKSSENNLTGNLINSFVKPETQSLSNLQNQIKKINISEVENENENKVRYKIDELQINNEESRRLTNIEEENSSENLDVNVFQSPEKEKPKELDLAEMHKLKKEKYKKERKKSSIFKSEDLRISKGDSNNLFISPRSNILLSNALLIKENTNPINEQCSYININNNINIYSPVSVTSIKNHLIESEIEKKVWDKSLNPLDSVKINSDFDQSAQKVNRKLFEADNLDLETINFNKEDKKFNFSNTRLIFDEEVSISPFNKKQMSITNEICLNIMSQKEVSLVQNSESIKTYKTFEQSSSQMTIKKENSNQTSGMNSVKSVNKIKHLKNPSLLINVNTNDNSKLQAYLNTLLRDKIFETTDKNLTSLPRSYSGSASRKNQTSSYSKSKKSINGIQNNISKEKNKVKVSNNSNKENHFNHVSLISNNLQKNSCMNEITAKKSLISNACPVPKMKRLNTPNYLKTKNSSVCASEFQNIFEKEMLREKKIIAKDQIEGQYLNNNSSTVTSPLQEVNPSGKVLKRKPHSYRTLSEIPNITSNKIKLIEALKILSFPKNSDHFKNSLEKLYKSKSLHFILFIDPMKKGFVI